MNHPPPRTLKKLERLEFDQFEARGLYELVIKFGSVDRLAKFVAKLLIELELKGIIENAEEFLNDQRAFPCP